MSIRISDETNRKLDKFKKANKQSSNDESIRSMLDFFSKFNLKPSDTFDFSFAKSVNDLSSSFTSRDNSLRKWIGKVSTVQLSSIEKNIEDIKLILLEKEKDLIIQKVSNSGIPEKVISDISEININEDIVRLENIIKEKNILLKSFTDLIEHILSLAQLQKGNVLSKTKYIIEMSEQDYENFKKLY